MPVTSCTLVSMLLISLAFWALSSASADDWKNYDLKSKPKVRVNGKETSKGTSARKIKQPLPEQTESVVYGSGPQGLLAKTPTETPKKEIKWGGNVAYALRTDMADQIEPRLYTHTLDLSYGFMHVP